MLLLCTKCGQRCEQMGVGVTLACHKHNTWRVTWNSVTLYVLLVTLTPPAALTTSRTRLSDSLGLNNTFYCLVELLQNIQCTCSSKIDSRLLRYVFECHVSWCSFHISQHRWCRGCVRHLNVIRMEFNLNSSSKHLIEVDVCNCIFVPFGWMAYVIKYSNLLGFYVLSTCKWIPISRNGLLLLLSGSSSPRSVSSPLWEPPVSHLLQFYLRPK